MAASVEDGMSVQLEYTLMVDDTVVDSNTGGEPLSYVQGRGEIIPGLERQLAGLHAGDVREITVSPEEGYGQEDPTAFVEVPKTQLPPDLTPEVGAVLGGRDQNGRPFRARIHDVGEERVTLDLNHPLAGKTLLFKIKVMGIAPAP